MRARVEVTHERKGKRRKDWSHYVSGVRQRVWKARFTLEESNGFAAGVAAGPGPLEIEAAEVARHIHRLADEVEAGDLPGFQGFAAQVTGVDAPQRDLGLAVAFRAVGRERPAAESTFQGGEGFGGVLTQRTGGVERGAERLRHAGGETLGEDVGEGGVAPGGVLGGEPVFVVGLDGQEVQGEFLVAGEVAADLQNDRTAETAVREEEALVEGARAGGRARGGRGWAGRRR